MTVRVNSKFFVLNPKSYLYGEDLYDLAQVADSLVDQDISIFVTAPYADLSTLSARTKKIIVTAQHMDPLTPGRGMGKVLPQSLYEAGARAVFLNHAEHPMPLTQLVKAVKMAKSLGMLSIVCADSLQEAQAIAMLNPDIILCEPRRLIGTGKSSNADYIQTTRAAIKAINPAILVMQAAGITNAKDVYETIRLGADGTGCTSGIVKAADKKEALTTMIRALKRAMSDE